MPQHPRPATPLHKINLNSHITSLDHLTITHSAGVYSVQEPTQQIKPLREGGNVLVSDTRELQIRCAYLIHQADVPLYVQLLVCRTLGKLIDQGPHVSRAFSRETWDEIDEITRGRGTQLHAIPMPTSCSDWRHIIPWHSEIMPLDVSPLCLSLHYASPLLHGKPRFFTFPTGPGSSMISGMGCSGPIATITRRAQPAAGLFHPGTLTWHRRRRGA
jgi:hypothetical protein